MVSEDKEYISYVLKPKVFYTFIKRVTDIVFSLIAIILLSPVLLILAIAVKITSPGPIFYRGVRTGRFGRTFRIFKFRTMIVGADKGAGTTSKNDPRLTSIGKFVRKYKLDELPQFFNVLIGEMSMVGPRPELPRYTSQYVGDELLILQVKPGITDNSSIEFINFNDLIDDKDPDSSFEKNILSKKNYLRVQYAKNRSYFGDLYIIFATIYKVIIK